MKKLVFVFACVAFVFIACQNKPLNNSELEAMYEKRESDEYVNYSLINNYSITDYEGVNEIVLPNKKGAIFISNVSGQGNTFFAPSGMLEGIGVEVSSLGKTVRVCYKSKPFFQASSFDEFSPIKFSFRQQIINENSFVFIHGDHDFQGEIGGLYVNGNLVSQKIMVKGGTPFIPLSVKKVKKKIIVLFSSANGASLYALFNENTGQLTLPTDYEAIEND